MPEHVVTFLLTEVVDSIRRWEDDETAMTGATERLDAIVRQLVAAHGGTLVKPRGEGDSHFLVFADPVKAATCAAALQRVVHEQTGLSLRTACHLGAAEFRGGDWYGTTVNRCARLRAVAHGRQSLVSADVATALLSAGLPDQITLRSLGRHRLKDLDESTEVFQVHAPGLVEVHPALPTLAQSHGLDLPRSAFVGRSGDCERAMRILAERGVVVVTGPPGVGTTRFATEVAATWWRRNDGKVCVVDGVEPADIAVRVSSDDLLLVHDAGTQSLDVVSGPAIVTARRPLHTHDQAIVRLRPLTTLDAQQLLIDRLPDDVDVVPELVTWCDGLPLAVELLARRASSVDGTVLAERLAADPLAILAGDRRSEPPRHSSMRATFVAAFDALDTQEQADLVSSSTNAASRGEPRWVAAGWHEPDGPLPLIAAFLREAGQRP